MTLPDFGSCAAVIDSSESMVHAWSIGEHRTRWLKPYRRAVAFGRAKKKRLAMSLLGQLHV